MVYELIRDLAAFVGASSSAVIGFATWQTFRAHRKPLELFYLASGVANEFYLIRISVANRSPSDRQADEAWLDLAAPPKQPGLATRAFKIVAKRVRQVAGRRPVDLTLLSMRGAVRQAARSSMGAAGVQADNPLYVPFKIGAFGTEEGTLLFTVFPSDEDLLERHGNPASQEFLDMMGQRAERTFLGRLTIKDDRGKTRAVGAFVMPPPRLVG
jgi:hypothetical protein